MENNNLPAEVSSAEIQPYSPEDDAKLDEHGRLIFEESIVFKLAHVDLKFIIESCMEVFIMGIVPPDDIGPAMELLERMASQEQEVKEKGALILPINYFVGLWHFMNAGRQFHIYKEDKHKDITLDKLTMRVAENLDLFHNVKKHEAAMEKEPEYFLNMSKNKVNLIPENTKDKEPSI